MDGENNFLFLGVGEGLPLSIVKRIIRKYEVKNSYATIFHKNEDNSVFSESPIYIWDAFYAKYPKTDQLKPVDRMFENPISQYSVEILHQMSRHGDWNFEKKSFLYYTHLNYWNNFLEIKKINFVFFSAVPHETYDFIIYLLCKAKKIKTCMTYTDGYRVLMTPKAYYMLNSVEEHTLEIREKFEKLKLEYRNMKWEDIILPDYIEQQIKKIEYRFENADSSSMHLMNQLRIEDVKHYYSDPGVVFKEIKQGNSSWKSLPRSFYHYYKGIQRTKKLVRKYEEIAVQPNFSDKYFFYALHYQPECTSSPLGGMYANQLLAIKLIAYNLPEGYWLYVKEHPGQSSFGREASYYEELAKIPKVKVISQRVTSEKLMKHAMAMATLTGTVIYESQIIQKPCFYFGYTSWGILDGTYKINTNKDCKDAINQIVEGRVQKTSKKDLRLYLKAMEEICFSKMDEEEFYQKLLQYIQL